jgi:hypothetical protein
MSDKLNPSSTPEKNGNNKPAANKPVDKSKDQSKKKFNPAQKRTRKNSRLTGPEWGGFFVDIYVTLWVWSDLIACHDIKRICFLLPAVFVAHGVLCYFISKIFNSWRWALFVWFLLSIPAAGITYYNSRSPSLDTKPKFVFSISNPDDPTDSLKLTNDCFAPHGWGALQDIFGGVLFPIKIGQSNFSLALTVNSTEYAEQLEVFATFPKEWGAVPDVGWKSAIEENAKAYLLSNGIVEPKELQTWGCRVQKDFNLLSGDGLSLPIILFTNLESLTINPPESNLENGAITFVAKAKGISPAAVGFRIFFLQTSNGYSFKPIVVTLFRTNNESGVFFPLPLRKTNVIQQ